MRSLEKGEDRITKICNELRQHTLEPAKEEAEKILSEAKQRAAEIESAAEIHAEQICKQAREMMEQEKQLFHTALQQGAQQAIETLRQQIEHHFFDEGLSELLRPELVKKEVVARLINGMVESVVREGIKSDLVAAIGQTVNPEEVFPLLLEQVRERLGSHPIQVGPIRGGVQLQIKGKKLTIDVSDEVVKELLVQFIRKDFRRRFFGC